MASSFVFPSWYAQAITGGPLLANTDFDFVSIDGAVQQVTDLNGTPLGKLTSGPTGLGAPFIASIGAGYAVAADGTRAWITAEIDPASYLNSAQAAVESAQGYAASASGSATTAANVTTGLSADLASLRLRVDNLATTGTPVDTTALVSKSANLSDLPSIATARTNLGLGTAALAAASTFATSAQGAKADTAVQPATLNAAIAGVGSGQANALGTPSNPVTDANAARPTGLTVVYWDCATQPVNGKDGDRWDH